MASSLRSKVPYWTEIHFFDLRSLNALKHNRGQYVGLYHRGKLYDKLEFFKFAIALIIYFSIVFNCLAAKNKTITLKISVSNSGINSFIQPSKIMLTILEDRITEIINKDA
jgi:hypothetical protein